MFLTPGGRARLALGTGEPRRLYPGGRVSPGYRKTWEWREDLEAGTRRFLNWSCEERRGSASSRYSCVLGRAGRAGRNHGALAPSQDDTGIGAEWAGLCLNRSVHFREIVPEMAGAGAQGSKG